MCNLARRHNIDLKFKWNDSLIDHRRVEDAEPRHCVGSFWLFSVRTSLGVVRGNDQAHKVLLLLIKHFLVHLVIHYVYVAWIHLKAWMRMVPAQH